MIPPNQLDPNANPHSCSGVEPSITRPIRTRAPTTMAINNPFLTSGRRAHGANVCRLRHLRRLRHLHVVFVIFEGDTPSPKVTKATRFRCWTTVALGVEISYTCLRFPLPPCATTPGRVPRIRRDAYARRPPRSFSRAGGARRCSCRSAACPLPGRVPPGYGIAARSRRPARCGLCGA
jgi:hypothetical protein